MVYEFKESKILRIKKLKNIVTNRYALKIHKCKRINVGVKLTTDIFSKVFQIKDIPALPTSQVYRKIQNAC